MSQNDHFTERIPGTTAKFSTKKAPGDFIKEHGVLFAGRHLLVDFWKTSRLNDVSYLEEALRDAAEAAGATLLNLKLHVFSPSGGVTGVASLSESHISIHTWPEHGFAALDIFMCGDAHPHRALTLLKSRLKPQIMTVGEYKRGTTP